MKTKKNKFIRLIIWIVSVVLLLMAITPLLFTNLASEKIKELANRNLDGKLDYKSARLSFFSHFPSLTLSLYEFQLYGSQPFEKDTLLAANEIAFGLNLRSLFTKKMVIDHVYFSNSFINIKVNEKGEPNYAIYTGSADTSKQTSSANESQLKIEAITIKHSKLVYDDQSLPMLIIAKDFNYKGKGDLTQAIFDLKTHVEIGSLDFSFDNTAYVIDKKINADLVTRVNTESLALLFEQNNIKINKLPLEFKGSFEFLKNGYGLDFTINSVQADLEELLSLLPPDFNQWTESSKMKGAVDLNFTLKGNYQPEEQQMPNVTLDLEIANASIDYPKAPDAINNLNCRFKALIPALNPDSLQIDLDTLCCSLGNDHFASSLHLMGLNEPNLRTRIRANADIEKWCTAFDIQQFTAKGLFSVDLNANGQIKHGPKAGSLRNDTVLIQIPRFALKTQFSKGFFKFAELPEPLQNAGFVLSAECVDGNPSNLKFDFKNFNINFLKNYASGFLSLNGLSEPEIKSDFNAEIDLQDIEKVVKMEGFDLKGLLKFNLNSNGVYDQARHSFPEIKASLNLLDASIKTPYYPNPISKIKVDVETSNPSGRAEDIVVQINPIAFEFEGKPFVITARLANFNNLQYQVLATGLLDLGKLNQVFGDSNTQVQGSLEANFKLKGSQSDAMNGQYQKLHNSGSLIFKNISLSTEIYPLPFIIHDGVFSFDQDKVKFSKFKATYGESDFQLTGNLNGITSYILENKPLQGHFNLTSKKIDVDSFMAFASTDTLKAKESSPNGVVILPKNIDIRFEATANQIFYNGIEIKGFKGTTVLKNQVLLLEQTAFNLVDCEVNMDATYGSIDPTRAYFQYHIKAKEFDIQKAYQQIKLFRDMASSAKRVKGIVSIDYEIKGNLDQNMMPIYPSLEGGGILTLDKVKVAGLGLFTQLSRSTERQDLKDPDLKKVEIKSSIKNNLINIEPVKMRIAGFRPRFSGTSSFDGAIKLKFRLGLPPLGIFGINMRVLGTMENPKILYGKGGNEEELAETEYKDTLSEDLLKRIKDAKEENGSASDPE